MRQDASLSPISHRNEPVADPLIGTGFAKDFPMATPSTPTTRRPRRTTRASPAAAPAPVSQTRGLAIGAGVLATVAALGAAVWRGWLKLPAFGPGNAEHEAPDLALDLPRPDADARAPVDFRPDPTAPVTAAEREGLRPATGPAPTLSADRGDVRSGPA
jgi:hypothetical protein